VKPRRSWAVSNAGPLIHLGSINRLHLLKALYRKVVIPVEVKIEAVDRGKMKGFSDTIHVERAIKEGWISIEEIKPNKEFKKVAKVAGLQPAEIAVIYHAYQNRVIALLDEDAARVFARTLGVSVRGSLGIILEALKTGLLSREEAIEALDRLSDVMYLAPDVYKLVRREIRRIAI
jgi:predicted nucleic acid-binding protein